VFMYHCGSPMVIQHMANGMYGAIIVDPKGGRPAAREYVLVQSEFYTGANAMQDMQDGNATFVVFNGYQNHYKVAPLTAKPGELVRLYVVDAGPNHWSAFHVIGALFSSVQPDGNPANQLQWMQTGSVAPGGGAVFELTIPDPGTYAFVSHSFADVGKGDVGVIKVSADAAAQPLVP
jgi:nitrite reductase (NO-forming)